MKNSLVFNVAEGGLKRLKRLFYNPYRKIGMSSFRFRKIKNLPANKTQTIDFLGKKLSFGSRTEFLHSLEEIFLEEIYKQEFDRPDPYVIDCGANIGLSVIYIKTLYPQAEVIAFEPDETNYRYLEQNIQSFGFSNVQIHKEAIWTENTYLNFQSEGSLASRIANDGDKSIRVKATRLYDLLDRDVDFLKIDIEGAEYAVFRDISDKIKLVKHIFLEYHGRFDQNSELEEILNILTTNGFRFYIKQALDTYPVPFIRQTAANFDLQLNIFCFRD